MWCADTGLDYTENHRKADDSVKRKPSEIGDYNLMTPGEPPDNQKEGREVVVTVLKVVLVVEIVMMML